MLMWLLFFFLAFGAKVVLAVAMIFLVLDAERDCAACATDTLPLQMTGWDRALSVLSLGIVQRRWCPGCRWEGLTRTGRTDRPGTVSPHVHSLR